MSNLKQDLKKLRDLSDADYTGKLKKIILNDTKSKIPDDYIHIINDKNNDNILRFSAFYCLFTQYRRFEQRHRLFELVETYLATFNDDIYNYLREIVWSQYYRFKFLDDGEKRTYKKAISHGRKAIDIYGDKSQNIGCFNNFAEIVLDAISYKNVVGEQDISDSIQYIDKAIHIQEIDRGRSPYSRYYCSKARLLSYQGNYKDAKKMIALAISYEKTDEKDSLIRIADYHNVALEIKTSESLELVNTNVAGALERYDSIQKQMEQQQLKYIEILGFFAATIALITGSISIAKEVSDFATSCGLIVCLASCLIISYSFLRILFSNRIGFWRIASTILISVLLFGFAFLLGKGII